MDPILLQQFREQLAAWTTQQLGTQRLPFQKLELCPRLLTDQGELVPDLVLWINRDSQMAGSIILLPDSVERQTLREAVAMARALGLGHFTTWCARKVQIWKIDDDMPVVLQGMALPPTDRIAPEDFRSTLRDLLDQLKIISITTAPSSSEFTLYYFANLCLHHVQELAPGLTISSRLVAGQTAADEWLAGAPLEKAWLSLWRVLFLLCRNQLPPGLLPERLEQAMGYALNRFMDDDRRLAVLKIRQNEPPLPDPDAVRLHHLASRMRQLGWPRSPDQTASLIELLVHEVFDRYHLASPQLPWRTDNTALWVNCSPSQQAVSKALVAPRPCLAGWAVKTAVTGLPGGLLHAEDLFSLLTAERFSSAVAVFTRSQTLDRNQRSTRLILLRQAWPNRRFDLPGNTPAWLWDALYLAGLVTDNLTVTFPRNWHKVSGLTILWSILSEYYQLTDIHCDCGGIQTLRLSRLGRPNPAVSVFRPDTDFRVPRTAICKQPGTLQTWMRASKDVADLLIRQELAAAGTQWSEWTAPLLWGTHLFLHTRLGRYLWELCSDQAALPGPGQTREAVLKYGMLLPDQARLAQLGLAGPQALAGVPDCKILEREFAGIFGTLPEVPKSIAANAPVSPRPRRQGQKHLDEIIDAVFVDGIPRFPDHYLMEIYRPKLIEYTLSGPLEITGAFFDRISLSNHNGTQTIEVTGQPAAEALVLASHTGQSNVALPEDESVLEDLLEQYRTDLRHLWARLVSECRRVEPHRKTASALAHKIWRQQGLPPISL